MPIVPRVMNRFHDKIVQGVLAAGGLKAKLFIRACEAKVRMKSACHRNLAAFWARGNLGEGDPSVRPGKWRRYGAADNVTFAFSKRILIGWVDSCRPMRHIAHPVFCSMRCERVFSRRLSITSQ